MKTKIIAQAVLVFLIFQVVSKAQINVGIGSGLHLNQSYKNIANAGNHSYIYSEALNISTQIGLKRKRYEMVLRLDYANIPQRVIFKFPFLDLPRFKFPRKTISPSFNLLFTPIDKFYVQSGMGILFTEKWAFHEKMEKHSEFASEPIFSESRGSPFFTFGFFRPIALHENVELRPGIHFRIGLKPLNSSFQHIDLKIENGSLLFWDVFYSNKGNALIADLSVVYYIRS